MAPKFERLANFFSSVAPGEQMLANAGGTLAGLVSKIQADQATSGRVIVKTTEKNKTPGAGAEKA